MSSPLPKRATSDIFYQFTKPDRKAKRKYDQQITSVPSGSSSNLKRHLKSRHIRVLRVQRRSRSRSPSTEELGEIQEMPLTSPTYPSPRTSSLGSEVHCPSGQPGCSLATPLSPTPTFQKPVSTFIRVKPLPMNKNLALDNQLFKMICKEYHSFSIVEDPEFRKFIHMLCPDYDLPSQKTLSNSLLPKLHTELVEQIKNNLANTKAIALTSDGWTSVNNVSFYALTAHFIQQSNSVLQSCLLECSQFEEKHSVENIASWVTSVLKKFDIHYKIAAMVTDNASNMKLAAIRLKFRHIPCFAQTLNLVIHQSIKTSIQKTVDQVKNVVIFFNKNSYASGKLEEMQDNLKKEKLKLKEGVATKWNSTYEMIHRFHLNKDPIISCIALLGEKTSKLNLDEKGWDILKYSIDILKMFDEMTKEVSTEKNLSLSKMGLLSRIIIHKLKILQEKNIDYPAEIQLLVSSLIKGLSEQFEPISNNELVAQSTLLDPRFKTQGFGNKSAFSQCYSSIISKMKSMIAQTPLCETAKEGPTSENSPIWEEFDKTISQLQRNHDAQSAAIIELNKYLCEPYLSRTEDPMIWWESRKLLYPNLYAIVLRRLCIPATSIPCERILSKAGQICCEKRSRLTSNKIAQILFVNHNT